MASLFKRNNGVFYVAYNDLSGRRRWQTTGTCDPIEADRIKGQIIRCSEKPRVITLKAFEQMIYHYTESNSSPGNVSVYKRSFKRFIRSTGDIIIKGVTPLLIEKFKQDCLKDVSPTTANIYLRTIRSAFNLAIEWRLIDFNPAKSCKQIRVPEKEPVFLTKEDINILLNHISDAMIKMIVILALHTAMRLGEICNLKWEDMDFANRTIRIRNRESFMVKGGHPRTIPMHAFVFREFFPLKQNNAYVFLDSKGQPLFPKNVSRIFKKYIHKSGLSNKYHFHSLRHTCASLLVQGQTPIYEIQKLLGHSSINTTQIYAHLENEHLRQSLDRLDLLTQCVNVN